MASRDRCKTAPTMTSVALISTEADTKTAISSKPFVRLLARHLGRSWWLVATLSRSAARIWRRPQTPRQIALESHPPSTCSVRCHENPSIFAANGKNRRRLAGAQAVEAPRLGRRRADSAAFPVGREIDGFQASHRTRRRGGGIRGIWRGCGRRHIRAADPCSVWQPTTRSTGVSGE